MARPTIKQLKEQHLANIKKLREKQAGDLAWLKSEITRLGSESATHKRERDEERSQSEKLRTSKDALNRMLIAETERSALLRGYIHANIPVKLGDLSIEMKKAMGITDYEC